MERNEIEQLIYRILATEDEEIDCDQLFELIARYVDLEVSGEEAARVLPMVHQHLEQCNACSELHLMLHELALLEEQDALPDPDDLLDEIVAGGPAPAKAEQPSASSAALRARPPSRDSVERRTPSPAPGNDTASQAREDRHREAVAPAQPAPWFRFGWAVAAAALIVVAVLGVWGWRQSSALAEMKRDMAFIAEADRAVFMQGTEEDPDARGYLFIDKSDKQGFLVIEGLNELPSDQVYQMWIMTDSSPVVGVGMFTVRAGERGRVWVNLDQVPGEFTRLAITPEPVGGSSAPTSSPVCVWSKQL